MQTNTSKKILRLPQVIEKTGRSRSTIYAAINAGDFPASIKLGVRSVGWLENEIEAWIQSRIEKSRLK